MRLVQYEKANSPMLVTLSGMVTVVRLQQSWKAAFPMLVNRELSGRLMAVRLLQRMKAASSILVTPSGRVMVVRLLHSQKAPYPMLATLYCTSLWVTVAGMVMEPEYLLSPLVTSAKRVPSSRLYQIPSISTFVCALAARDSNVAKRISKCFFILFFFDNGQQTKDCLWMVNFIVFVFVFVFVNR